MCFGSAPKAPDPMQTAQAQNSVNAEAIANSARFNRTNQVGPFGSQTYSGTPGTADDTLTTSLSPELQRLLTGQTDISQGLTDQALTRLGQIPSDAFSISGAPGVRAGAYAPMQDSIADAGPMSAGISYAPITDSFDKGGPVQYDIGDAGDIQRGVSFDQNIQKGVNQDFGSLLNSSRNAAYDSQAQYLDPRFGREQQAMESQLAAQGIPVGSEAYKSAMAQFGETKNQAYQGAQNAATLAGNQLQGQLFGQSLQGGQFANQAQQQGYEQALGSGAFGNAAQAQYFGQLATRQQANNQAAGQDYGQNMGAAQFSNDANMLKFGQNQAVQQFMNDTQAQRFGQNLASGEFANNANLSKFDMNQALRQGDIGDRERYINENILQRNQGFNELAAFLNGSPISPSQPAFAQTPQYSAAQGSPDLVGLAANNYTQQSQSRAALLSSIFGAAGKVGGAAVACWVAREVYGVENPKWLQFRAWLVFESPRWFCKLYMIHGPRFAEWLHDKPKLKALVRKWMDRRIAGMEAHA